MTHRPLGESQAEAQRLRWMRHLEDAADAAEDLSEALAAASAGVYGLLPLALAYDALPVRVVEEFATI